MGGQYESTILGKGVIPVKEVIDLGKNQGYYPVYYRTGILPGYGTC